MKIIKYEKLIDLLFANYSQTIKGLTMPQFIDLDFIAVKFDGTKESMTLHELLQHRSIDRCDGWTDGVDIHIWVGKGCRRKELLRLISHEWAHINLPFIKNKIKEEDKAVAYEEKICDLYSKGIITPEVNECLSLVDYVKCVKDYIV